MLDVIKAIPKTFFSPAFYWDLVRRWSGIGIGFVLVLTLIVCVHSAIVLFIPIQKIIEMVPEFFASLPVATIKDHRLSIDQPVPYKINFDLAKQDEQEPATAENMGILVDTNYTIDDLEELKKKMQDDKILILFTAEHMISFKDGTNEIRIEDLSTLPDTVVTHERWVNFGRAFMIWMPVFLALLVAVGSFMGNILGVFIFALVALSVGVFSKSIADFGAAMRLSAATAIPSCILFLLLPYSFVFKALVWAGYIVFGAWCARKQPILTNS